MTTITIGRNVVTLGNGRMQAVTADGMTFTTRGGTDKARFSGLLNLLRDGGYGWMIPIILRKLDRLRLANR